MTQIILLQLIVNYIMIPTIIHRLQALPLQKDKESIGQLLQQILKELGTTKVLLVI